MLLSVDKMEEYSVKMYKYSRNTRPLYRCKFLFNYEVLCFMCWSNIISVLNGQLRFCGI